MKKFGFLLAFGFELVFWTLALGKLLEYFFKTPHALLCGVLLGFFIGIMRISRFNANS